MNIKDLKINIPGPLKTLLKLAISVIIIIIIVRKIDEKLLLQTIGAAHPLWLIWAVIWFIISKIISAFRFNLLLSTEGIRLPTRQNLRLYWLGMYYNLLLPGGISGDGYKIKVLMEEFRTPFRRMFVVTLLDRISGAIALGQLCLILLLWVPELQHYWYIVVPGFFISLLTSWWIYRWAKGNISTVWIQTTLQSIGVQGAQAVATLGLVLALGQGPHWPDYLILFLVSSLVAMLPFTIGGAGARELTFMYGAQWLDIHTEKAVAIGFLFYLISTAVSLYGMVYSFHREWIFKKQESS
ncbi:MAG: lysylphosphatidylglycerol synthase transmembrane domain-containing protein [Saprospiraceae bacterium]